MRVLYLEDSETDADLNRRDVLRHAPQATVDVVTSLAEARRRLEAEPPYDLLLSDLALPDGSGLELISEIRERRLPLAVVLLTGTGDADTVVAALRAGADDYLLKGVGQGPRLARTLEGALRRFRTESARRPGLLRLLYFEPSPAVAARTRRHMERHAPNVRLDVVGSLEDLRQRIRHPAGTPCPCDVLLLECRLEGDTALDVLKDLLAAGSLHVPVVLLGEEGDESLAAYALRLGAQVHYLVKHRDYLHALPATLEAAHRAALLERERGALLESQARLASLIEGALDGIVSVDDAQRVVLFNPAAERMFGCAAREALGRPLGSFVPAWAEGAELARLLGLEGAPRHTVAGRRADGSEFPVEASLARSRVGGGDLVTAILRDVTSRVRDEARLRDSEERFRQLAESVDEVFWMYDPAAGRVLYVNPAYQRIWGQSGDELYTDGEAWSRAILPEDRAGARRAVETLSDGEYRIQRPDGAVRWIHDRPSPVVVNGEVVRLVGVATDVTARKEAERALEDERAFVETLLRSVPGLVFVVDRDGGLVRWNQAYEDVLGRPTAGQDSLLPIHPDDRKQLGAAVAAVFAEGGIGQAEGRLLDAAGRARDYLFTGARVEIAGRVLLVGTGTDVTDRNRVEAALRESEDRFRSYFEAPLVGIAIVAPDRRWIEVNERFCAILGRTREEMDATDWLESTHPDDREESLAAIGRLDRGEVDGFVLGKRFLRKGGGVVHTEVSVRAVRRAGEIEYYVALVQDVTARVEAESARLVQEERLRLALDGADLGTWHWDVAPDKLLWSDRCLAIHGLSPGAVPTRADVDAAIHADDRESLAEATRSALRGGPFEVEYRVVWRDRSEHWIASRGRAYRGPDGRAVRLEGVAREVTEQKRLREQLQQSQKMEAVGRLAGGVAHDFNNMLGVILGHAELALGRCSPSDPVRRSLDEIRAAAQRSAELTQRLLAFSRRQTIAPKVLDVNARMRAMDSLLRRIIGEDVDLELALGADLGRVRIDPSQLDQMVANLAINSRDAMPQGGRLVVATTLAVLGEAECPVGGPRPGPYVVLAVTDTGSGMDAHTLERAFEPFFTTKGEGKGTGLGLAMVYGIVSQNGGLVRIASELGQGTTVSLYLPRVDDEGEQAPADAVSAARRGHETILLVEDEPSLRELTQELLLDLGYQVLTGATAAEALEECRRHPGPIELLLTDVVMPQMNGRQVAEQVRALCPGIRVLYTSGYTANVIAHQGVLDRGVAFLEKPFSRESLARQVRLVLDSPA